jgi:hypothetical protein
VLYIQCLSPFGAAPCPPQVPAKCRQKLHFQPSASHTALLTVHHRFSPGVVRMLPRLSIPGERQSVIGGHPIFHMSGSTVCLPLGSAPEPILPNLSCPRLSSPHAFLLACLLALTLLAPGSLFTHASRDTPCFQTRVQRHEPARRSACVLMRYMYAAQQCSVFSSPFTAHLLSISTLDGHKPL